MSWWTDKAWYLLFWLAVFVAARWFLVNPVIDAIRRLKD